MSNRSLLALGDSIRGFVKQVSEHSIQKNLSEADRLFNVGKMESERGRKRHALNCFNEALVLQREILGNDDPDAARTLNEIGTTLADIGEDFAALTAFEEALYIRQTVLGAGHEDAAETLTNLTLLLRSVQEKEEAADAERAAQEEESHDDLQELGLKVDTKKEKAKSWSSQGPRRLSAKIEKAIGEGRRRSTLLLSGMKVDDLDSLKRLDQELDEEEERLQASQASLTDDARRTSM